MNRFQYINAPDIQTATALLQQPATAALAGGTDLLPELKKHIRTPQRLVNLKNIPQTCYIHFGSENIKIGALTTITEVEESPDISKHFPILSQAAATVGSPQIRNAGTIGGNLCQSVRCWYYRHPELQCWLKGGKTCYARNGLNRHHAVVGKSQCVAVNPSDLAPALIALDASVKIAKPDGTHDIPIESLYRLPDANHRAQAILTPGELIVEISIPKRSKGSSGIYLKVMERATWSFALVSVAVQFEWNGDSVAQGRIVLGGMASIPWRVHEAEKLLSGQKIDDSLAQAVSEASVLQAKPLEGNSYKIPMVKNLVKRALLALKRPRKLK
jgi:xanthine dehydrogenase YagS FAD-binding subunit